MMLQSFYFKSHAHNVVTRMAYASDFITFLQATLRNLTCFLSKPQNWENIGYCFAPLYGMYNSCAGIMWVLLGNGGHTRQNKPILKEANEDQSIKVINFVKVIQLPYYWNASICAAIKMRLSDIGA